MEDEKLFAAALGLQSGQSGLKVINQKFSKFEVTNAKYFEMIVFLVVNNENKIGNQKSSV